MIELTPLSLFLEPLASAPSGSLLFHARVVQAMTLQLAAWLVIQVGFSKSAVRPRLLPFLLFASPLPPESIPPLV